MKGKSFKSGQIYVVVKEGQIYVVVKEGVWWAFQSFKPHTKYHTSVTLALLMDDVDLKREPCELDEPVVHVTEGERALEGEGRIGPWDKNS